MGVLSFSHSLQSVCFLSSTNRDVVSVSVFSRARLLTRSSSFLRTVICAMDPVLSAKVSQEFLDDARPYADAVFSDIRSREFLKKIIEDAEDIAKQRNCFRHANESYSQQPITYRGKGLFHWDGSPHCTGLLQDQFLTMAAKKCMCLP